jgi:hypothetical protein
VSKLATIACLIAVLALSGLSADAGASSLGGPVASISKGKSKGKGHQAKKKPSTVFKAYIGWIYTSTPDFPQSTLNPLVIHWGACASAGGVKIQFPLGKHIFEGYNGGFDPSKPVIASLSGPPLNPKDPFSAEIYVGDLASPGTTNLNLKCLKLKHGKLATIFSAPLKTEYVRQDVNFYPANVFTAEAQMNLFGTEPQIQTVANRSCQELGTPSITISSPAIASPTYVTLPADGGTIQSEGLYKGTVTPSKEAGEGSYEAVVSCGTGRVGVGIVKVL